MRKIYLGLVIVLTSLFMANEAAAQQYIGLDNQRGDDLAVTIVWRNCSGGLISTYTVCANSSLVVFVPLIDAVIRQYQTDQTTFVCSSNCGYRIGMGTGSIQLATACNDYAPKNILDQLWSGTSGGTMIGNHVFNYTPNTTYQGIMTFLP